MKNTNFLIILFSIIFISFNSFGKDFETNYNQFVISGNYHYLNSDNSGINETLLKNGIPKIENKAKSFTLSYYTKLRYFSKEYDSSIVDWLRKNIIFGISYTFSLPLVSNNENFSSDYDFNIISLKYGINTQIYKPFFIRILLGLNYIGEKLIINKKDFMLNEILNNKTESQKFISKKWYPSIAVGIDFLTFIKKETPARILISNIGVGILAEYIGGSNPYDYFEASDGAVVSDLGSNILNRFNFKVQFVFALTQNIFK